MGTEHTKTSFSLKLPCGALAEYGPTVLGDGWKRVSAIVGDACRVAGSGGALDTGAIVRIFERSGLVRGIAGKVSAVHLVAKQWKERIGVTADWVQVPAQPPTIIVKRLPIE